MKRDQSSSDRSGALAAYLRTLSSCILLTGFVGLPCGVGKAAPVTLQFEAVVGPPRQGASGPLPPGWNASLLPGDTVTGSFTFEPINASTQTSRTTVVEQFEFSLRIKTNVLRTVTYRVDVTNNLLAVDDPDMRPDDAIRIGCFFIGGPHVCSPANVSPGVSAVWAFEATLIGDEDVLDGADIPGDIAVWQQFGYSSLAVSFFEPQGNRYYGFFTTRLSFVEVPEPNASFVLLMTLQSLALRRSRWTCRTSFVQKEEDNHVL